MLKSIDERIENFSQAILGEANAEAEKMRTEAKAKETEILKEGQLRAERIRTELLEKAKTVGERLSEEQLAEVKIKAKIEWMERREKLLESVFQTARAGIKGLIDTPEYPQALLGLITDAIRQVQSKKVVLHLDHASLGFINKDILNNLRSNLGVEIELGDEIQSGIGVIVSDIDGHRIFDNTLESRLNRKMENLRSEVYKILMEEEL